MPPDDLIIRYLNDECTDAETRTLGDWLRESDANADEFMRAASLHSRLRRHFTESPMDGAVETPTAGKLLTFPAPVSQSGGRRRSYRIALAIAAALAVMLTVFTNLPRSFRATPTPKTVATGSPAPPSAEVSRFARVTHEINAQWQDGSPEKDQWLAAVPLRLVRGSAQLRFATRVDVTLRAPATIQILDTNRVRLEEGTVAAYVPPGAEGFSVRAGVLDVVDLGTFFGVQTREPGQVDVTVFEGEVALRTESKSAVTSLSEGQAVVARADGSLQHTNPDLRSYDEIWSLALGIASKDQIFRLVTPNENSRGMRFSDDEILVKGETGFAPLPADMIVNISAPGTYQKVGQLTELRLRKGTVVRPYLLQFQPSIKPSAFKSGHFEFLQVRGELTFTDPVIGIIILEDELRASERILVSPKLPGKRTLNRSIELSDREFGDEIHLSADRRTLRVSLRATSGFSDHIRVFVAARE